MLNAYRNAKRRGTQQLREIVGKKDEEDRVFQEHFDRIFDLKTSLEAARGAIAETKVNTRTTP